MFWRKPKKDGTEKEKVRSMFAKRLVFILLALTLAVVLIGISITIGTSGISVADAYMALVNCIFPGTFNVSEQVMRIVISLRAPRVLMALFGGAALAIGGCVTQSLMKNPLATPYTLGVSSGAGLGAALAILLGISVVAGPEGIILNAFLFSLIPIGVVLLASKFKAMTPIMMILCGVAISYMFSACNTIFQFFGEPDAVKSVVFWMVGDLNGVSLWNVPYVAAIALVAFFVIFFLSKDINIMRMGDDTAKGLGVNVGMVRLVCLVLSCLVTAVVVSFAGGIGFICLLAPQISRMLVGNEMHYLLPMSAFVGACLLSLADMLAKTVMAPIMLPVGAVTALVGGPVLIFLILRSISSYSGDRT